MITPKGMYNINANYEKSSNADAINSSPTIECKG